MKESKDNFSDSFHINFNYLRYILFQDYLGTDGEDMLYPKTKGTVIFFPSFLRHAVTPVTKGERKSLVLWVHGKPFR